MNPEGGSLPEEAQEEPAEPAPETPAETPSEPSREPAARVPPRPRGFWDRVLRRRAEEVPGADFSIQAVSEADQQQISDQEGVRRVERLQQPQQEIEIPNTPEELAELLARLSSFQWRERQIQERYGQGQLGQLRAFLAGERDFALTQDGTIQRNAWNELGRKVANVGLKIAPGVVAIGVVGIFTGGVSLPAIGAVYGAAGGQGIVEAWHSLNGGERRVREEIARVQYQQWFRLREMAKSSQEEGITSDQKNERLSQLIDAFYQTNEDISSRQQELVGIQQVWNRRRKIGQLLGGIAGLGAGIWAGFAGLSRQAMTMDIDGDKISHLVERVNGAWHYVYNTTQEVVKAATQGATLTPDAAGYATHALGESTATVVQHAAKNLVGHAAQIGGALAGLWAGSVLGRNLGTDNEAAVEAQRGRQEAARELERQFQREQVPPPAGPEPATEEQLDWRERFENQQKPMPEVGSVWVNESHGEIGAVRINNLDLANGTCQVTFLGPNMERKIDIASGNPVPDQLDYSLETLLNSGSIQENFIARWQSQFQPGDHIQTIPDLSDNRGRPITPEDYQILIDDEHREEVVLRRAGQADIKAPSFFLAFMGVNRLEPAAQPEARRERIRPPGLNTRWVRIGNVNDLPERFRDLPEIIIISNVDNNEQEIDVYDEANRQNQRTIRFEDWSAIAGIYRREGMAGGQQQGQRRGGGRNP